MFGLPMTDEQIALYREHTGLMPPATVGGARRIDDIAEIRRLAKRWKNCLADRHLDAVNDGRSAVYLWPDAKAPSVCVVTRHGRLGWALEAAKGPENAELPPARLEEICRAFAAAGIPKESAIEGLEQAVHRRRWLRQHGPRQVSSLGSRQTAIMFAATATQFEPRGRRPGNQHGCVVADDHSRIR
jgi:hypothetical protein